MPRPIHYNQPVETQPDPPKVMIKQEDREAALREAVLDNIGTPDDLWGVQIRILQDPDHYRVNILRNIKGHPKITNSYYVTMVMDGIVSNPPMEFIYFDAVLESKSFRNV